MLKIELPEENIGIGYLTLINPAHPIKSEPEELTAFSKNFPEITLNAAVNRALKALLDKIKAEEKIVPVSGYRSFREQTDIYNTSLKENGIEYTKSFVALPGASEHQTGLAVDLALNEGEIDFICPRFPYEGICQSFRRLAPKYGFIERYKADKREITGIAAEEWHFRYVGLPHAEIITEKGLCLEEYIEFLKRFTYPNTPLSYGKYRIFYIPCGFGGVQTDRFKKYLVSGNNADGFILTFKEESK